MKLYLLLSLLVLISCIEPQGELQPLEGDFNTEVSTTTLKDGVSKCLRLTPTMSVGSQVMLAKNGEEITYKLIIKDNNKDCGGSDYGLSTVNSNSQISLDVPSLVRLESGESKVIEVSFKADSASSAGDYGFKFVLKDLKSDFSNELNQIVKVSMTTPNCLRANPSVTIPKSIFEGYTGASFSFEATIINNNQYCDSVNYIVGYEGIPNDFSYASPGVHQLASGESKTIAVSVKAGSTVGEQKFKLKAVDLSLIHI